MVTKIGIAGTGLIGQGIFHFLHTLPEYSVSRILTRRRARDISFAPIELVTNSINDLIDHCDIVIECSGDAVYATEVLIRAAEADKKIITMDAEFQVTAGSAIVSRGAYITEAHGDQPGSFAELHKEALAMGFEPVAYLNVKGFLNHNPTSKEMNYWAKKQDLTLNQVTSFTDGTKLQIEQTLIANGLNTKIVKQGLMGPTISDVYELDDFVREADKLGQPISDYVVSPQGPPGVIIVAKSAEADRLPRYNAFTKVKTHDGLGYVLVRPYHLCHLEIGKTLQEIASGEPPLLNNSKKPTVTVASIAKRPIRKGEKIKRALGGFDIRGEAVTIKECPDAVPITLLNDAVATHDIEPDQTIVDGDFEIPHCLAWDLYHRSLDGFSKSSPKESLIHTTI